MSAAGVLAVIPAYNEAATIAAVIDGVRAHLERIIVVDDGSSDRTAAIVADLPVTLVRHERNRGKGASLRTGLAAALAAGALRVVTLDADGQHDTDELPGLLAVAAAHPDDVILGARLLERAAIPTRRRLAQNQGDFWISWAAGQRILDTNSGFRIFPAALLPGLLERCRGQERFAYEAALLIEASRQGHRIRPAPITAIYPDDARASHYRPLADTWPIMRLVGGHLFKRGLAPLDLLRALGLLAPRLRATG